MTWCDFERVRGAYARFRFKGRTYQKFFSGLPKSVAIETAFRWVVAEKRRRKQSLVWKRWRGNYPKDSTLPVGVSLTRDGRVQAYASVGYDWRQSKRYFSIARYGRRRAIALAVAQRCVWERVIREREESLICER